MQRERISSIIRHEKKLRDLRIAELQARKEKLKQLLIQLDKRFVRKHKRMPFKDEKEPIRPLYDHYNDLKVKIKALEEENVPIHIDISRCVRESFPSYGSPKNPSIEKTPSSSQVARIPEGASSQELLEALIKTEKNKWHQTVSRVKDFFKEHNRQQESPEQKSPRKLVARSLELLDDATWSASVFADELMETVSNAKEDLLETFAEVIEKPPRHIREKQRVVNVV